MGTTGRAVEVSLSKGASQLSPACPLLHFTTTQASWGDSGQSWPASNLTVLLHGSMEGAAPDPARSRQLLKLCVHVRRVDRRKHTRGKELTCVYTETPQLRLHPTPHHSQEKPGWGWEWGWGLWSNERPHSQHLHFSYRSTKCNTALLNQLRRDGAFTTSSRPESSPQGPEVSMMVRPEL